MTYVETFYGHRTALKASFSVVKQNLNRFYFETSSKQKDSNW